MAELKTNVLYFGDNLDILRKYIPDKSIDLIYLDPPFNSKRDYNILYKENGGLESEAQIKAFKDTWHWTEAVERTYYDIVQKGPQKVSSLIDSLHSAIGQNDVMAYLVMMTIRLVELHRKLKPTGSLYLHCDPTASHYLKIVLDQIFGPTNFRNEIAWKRFSGHGNVYHSYARVKDILLFYTKSNEWKWNQGYVPLSEQYIESFFQYVEPETGRRYRLQNVLNPNKNRPNLTYEWNGHIRVWKWTKEKMQNIHDAGLLVYSKKGLIKGFKQYLDTSKGQKLDDMWTDIRPIGQSNDASLGYDTQKPLALLERIINASSNGGDVVLDPFCGCGTAVVAAQKLNRKWIGIDITHLAINLMRNRLRDSFPGIEFEVVGEPKDVASAKALANQKPDGRYQFQWWALGLIGAHPIGDKKKGADKGVDGIISFIDNVENKANRVIVQVKSGHVSSPIIQQLKAVAGKDAIGVLVTLEPPTEPMKKEALDAGYYHSPVYDKNYARIQILTVEELFQGKTVEMPPQTQTSITFTKAPKLKKKDGEQITLPGTS